MLLKVSWMVCVCQAVATCPSRSQWQKSSSVLANSFFHKTWLLAALEFHGLRKKQTQDRGQHGELPAPTVKARRGELRFVCADGCCALQFVNCIEFPPAPRRLTIADAVPCCVYECDSQTHQRHNLPTDLWDCLPCFIGNPNDSSRDCTDF